MRKAHLLFIGLILCYWIKAVETGTVKPHLKNKVMYSPNMGQVLGADGRPVNNVLAKSSINGLDFYVTTTGVTYVLKQYEEVMDAPSHPVYINEPKFNIKYSRVDVVLAGAAINAAALQFNGLQQLQVNYYQAGNKGITGVKNYSSVTIKNVYPGIDWVWKSTNDGKLEYDFVVRPGSSPAQIKMQYKYADITPSANSILIGTHNGTLREGDLKANCDNQPVDVAYVYNAANKEIAFNVGSYDNSKDLIIDPPLALQWSAQYGGTFADGLRGVDADTNAHIYLTGYTTSTNFPSYNPGGGAYYDGSYNGNTDALVMKLDSNQQLIWATYMGGNGNDFGNSVTRSKDGNIYVTGGAENGFPALSLNGAYNQSAATLQDIFLARFDTSLALQWCTFYGGTGIDEGLKVHADIAGQVYVTGHTNSPGGSFQVQQQSGGYVYNNAIGNEGFILKFDNNGARLWSTLYGGAGDDYVTSATTDSSGVLIVAGFTTSTNLPLINSGVGTYYQPTNLGGTDGFIARFNNFTTFFNGTYIGGSGNDYINDVTTGLAGEYLFTGRTSSVNFPITALPGFSYNQTTLAGSYDGFIFRFRNDLVLKWSTYFGGSDLDVGTGVTTDEEGRLYITGFTFSNNFPVDSPNYAGAYYRPTRSGAADGFTAGFSRLGLMFWSTYKGDSCYDYPADIAFAQHHNKFYVCGEGLYGCNQSFPDTGQMNHNGGGVSASDGFVWGFNGEGAADGGGGGGGPCLNVSINVDVQPCPGSCNGAAKVSVSGGVEPYLIYWYNGSTDSITGGICSYDDVWVQVQDINGCSGEAQVILNPLKVTVNATDANCYTGLGGSLSASASGGTAPYHYLWSTGDSIANIPPDVMSGGYDVTVTDMLNCTAIGYGNTVPIDEDPDVIIGIVKGPACGESNGILVALDRQTENPVEIYWSTGVFDDTIYNVGTGYYSVQSFGCVDGHPQLSMAQVQDTIQMAAYISEYISPDFCVSDSGVLSVNFRPEYVLNLPVTYNWSTGETTGTISGLSAGYYTVTVTDASGCEANLDEMIFPGGKPVVIFLSTDFIAASCYNDSSGAILAPGVTGQGPFTYQWSNGENTTGIGPVLPGVYTLTVTAANGCSATTTGEVGYFGSALLDFTATNVTCHDGADGFAQVQVVNPLAVAPYTYSWGNGSTVQTANNLTAGSYPVTVTDANGLVMESCVTINEPPALVVRIEPLVYNCSTQTLQLLGNVIGGTPGYGYSWYNGATTDMVNVTQSETVSVTVTDFSGCTVTSDTLIEIPEPLVASYTAEQILCNGDIVNVTISAGGGVAPYLGEAVYNLPAGSYDYVVSDLIGCESHVVFDLVEPDQLQVTASHGTVLCGYGATWLEVEATGGTAPYTGTGNFTVSASTQNIVVVDANGCTSETTVSIPVVDDLAVGASTTPLLCHNDSSEVVVIAQGGLGTITGTGTYYLPVGSYNITVADSLCTVVVPIDIDGPPQLVVDYEAAPILCAGLPTNVTITASGGTAPYINTGTYSYLAGTYSVIVVDNNGCLSSASIIVTEPEPLDADVYTSPILCNGDTSVVSIQASGGVQPYISGTGLYYNTAGDYEVVITDVNGCTKTANYTINEPAALQIEVTVPDTIDCTKDSVEVYVNASGGVGPYTGTGSYYYYGTGTYYLEVSDANGCVVSSSASVIVSGAGTEIIASDDTICVNGAVYLTATGDFEFTWYPYNFQSGGLSIAHVPATTTVNIVGVNDAGCYAYDTLTIVVQSCDTTSINDIDALQFTVYPNPATDKFVVQADGGFTTSGVLTLHTTDGRLVKEQQITAGVLNAEVDCATLASGVYLMQINSSGKNYYHKVIVSR